MNVTMWLRGMCAVDEVPAFEDFEFSKLSYTY